MLTKVTRDEMRDLILPQLTPVKRRVVESIFHACDELEAELDKWRKRSLVFQTKATGLSWDLAKLREGEARLENEESRCVEFIKTAHFCLCVEEPCADTKHESYCMWRYNQELAARLVVELKAKPGGA